MSEARTITGEGINPVHACASVQTRVGLALIHVDLTFRSRETGCAATRVITHVIRAVPSILTRRVCALVYIYLTDGASVARGAFAPEVVDCINTGSVVTTGLGQGCALIE